MNKLLNKLVEFPSIQFGLEMAFMSLKSKIQFVFELIKQVDRVPKKFLSPITGYKGLFELRIEYQSNIFRVFCCFDADRLVVLFNGFQKKTQKTPKKEIEKAIRLKNEYFKLKNQ